ncbi:hypothetical protein GCM10023165_15620 [Variovorax defluvii]|uniref:GtrA/DPMS transmembrane domain-containing protein n=2 Tax=Variovorax defluvii TaxID=913761 RepID=A0ABP8HD84_9BURK
MELIRYAFVGVLNTGLGYAVIFLCMGVLDWSPVASNIAGYAVGFVVSFTLNRSFTFRSKGPARRELRRFLLIFALAYLANLAVLVLCVHAMGLDGGWAQVIAGFGYFGLSFALSKYYVFAEGAGHRDAGSTGHV